MPYEIVERSWTEAGMKVAVIKLPEKVIADKLAVLSTGDGRLSFTKYDRFLSKNCLVDEKKAIAYLDNLAEKDSDRLIRAAIELRNIILQVNPLLDPTLLIINSEGLIKIPDEEDKPGEVRTLVENPDWDKVDFGDGDLDIDEFLGTIPPPVHTIFGGLLPPMFGMAENIVPHEWELLDWPLGVIEYQPSDVPKIFREVYEFEDKEHYMVYITTKCISDFTNVFIMLDKSGTTDKYSSEELTAQLYEICVEHNPFLSWEDIDLSKVKKAVLREIDTKGNRSNPYKKTDPKSKENGEVEEKFSFEDVSEDEIITLPNRIKKWVRGQDSQIDSICESIQLGKCGFKEPHQPIGVFLLTGESGSGKTYTSKILSKELCGSEDAMFRIDCSEYSERHAVSNLLGSPRSYVGYDDPVPFVEKMTENPFRVILLDEIDKAHSKLYDIFLQVFDEGNLSSSKGERLDFSQSIILMTANIGIKDIEKIKGTVGFGSVSKITSDKFKAAMDKAVKSTFRPEFINRIDNVLTFNRLDKITCLEIIDLEFMKMNDILKEKNIVLKYTAKVKDYLYDKGFKDGYGARPLKRCMKTHIYTPLSRQMLKEGFSGNVVAKVSVKNNELTFKITKKK